jgi:hypothetical protein
MNKTGTHAFVNQLLIYTLVMIGFSGSVGMGAVWLRHQISVTANRTKQIEARLAEVERHYRETEAAIGTEQGPEALKQRNTEWRLGLVSPKDTQIVRVNESPEERLAAKRNQGLFTDNVRLVGLKPGGLALR